MKNHEAKRGMWSIWNQWGSSGMWMPFLRAMEKMWSRQAFAAALFVLMLAAAPHAVQAQEYNAELMDTWMASFAAALSSLAPLNDPQETADPARAGQYLLEYEFGTVLASSAENVQAADIMEINVRTAQVIDCRGLCVGMYLQDVLGSEQISGSGTLLVLSTQEAGMGWSWAYVGEQGVYGVEYITYGGEGVDMREYTLTYVIDEDEAISAIRIKRTDATLAQAQSGLQTAEEIAGRQQTAVLVPKNNAAMFGETDLQVMGADALGVEVAHLVTLLGEPEDVQTLPTGAGRILLYDGMAVELALEERTGVELVRGLSVSGESIIGPRGLHVGMSLQTAAALFACEADVASGGGTLYVAGEALGEPPYGEVLCGISGDVTLRYVCDTLSGEAAMLEIGVQSDAVTYWHLFFGDEAAI